MILIQVNSFISRREISNLLKINESAVQKHIVALKQTGLIELIGGDFGEQWKIPIETEKQR